MGLLKKPWLLGLGIAIIFLAAIWVLVLRPNTIETQEEVLTNLPPTSYEEKEWNTNEAGQKWTVSDTADFVVSGGDEAGIKFWEGQIDPLKVVPGMTQTMRIVVSSPSGLVSVTAEIETDTGINNVELKKTGVLAAKDLSDRHGVYVIQPDGVLAINNPEEARAWRLALAKQEESGGLIAGALAASGEREVWEGSWVVKDTSVKKYNTAFVARDSAGQENTMNMAWSDPCNQQGVQGVFWPNSGNAILKDGCAIATTYGVDGGSLEIQPNGSLTLNSGAVMAFNPQKNITFNKSLPGTPPSITILAGASIQKKYLWAVDKDGDNYISGVYDTDRWVGDSSSVAPNTGEQQQGRLQKFFNFFTPAQAQVSSDLKRQSTIVSHTVDCYDDNANAKPGQTTHFSTDRGDGSFDYNCDGNNNKMYPYSYKDSADDCYYGLKQAAIDVYEDGVRLDPLPSSVTSDQYIIEGEFQIDCGQQQGNPYGLFSGNTFSDGTGDLCNYRSGSSYGTSYTQTCR